MLKLLINSALSRLLYHLRLFSTTVPGVQTGFPLPSGTERLRAIEANLTHNGSYAGLPHGLMHDYHSAMTVKSTRDNLIGHTLLLVTVTAPGGCSSRSLAWR